MLQGIWQLELNSSWQFLTDSLEVKGGLCISEKTVTVSTHNRVHALCMLHLKQKGLVIVFSFYLSAIVNLFLLLLLKGDRTASDEPCVATTGQKTPTKQTVGK